MNRNTTSRGPTEPAPEYRRRPILGGGGASILARGEPWVWLLGGGLTIALAMTVGLLALVVLNGVTTLWPRPVVRFDLVDGRVWMGEVTREEHYALQPGAPEARQEPTAQNLRPHGERTRRRLVRIGNFELTQEHFRWIHDFEIQSESRPEWAVVLERLTWGRFYGEPVELRVWHRIPMDEARDGSGAMAVRRRLAEALSDRIRTGQRARVAWVVRGEIVDPANADIGDEVEAVVERHEGPEAAWAALQQYLGEVHRRSARRRNLEKYEIGRINRMRELARLQVRQCELDLERARLRWGPEDRRVREASAALDRARATFDRVEEQTLREFERLREEIRNLNEENARYRLILRTADGQLQEIPLAQIVRAYPANRLRWKDKLRIYASRWREFLLDDPREANMEGGVFPAIFGTVTMTLLMSFVVAPFGVLAALYLREYAKAGPLISAVRIAINNLAGVPSIVFGVFGLGFFCYGLGGWIDRQFFAAKLPVPTYGTGGVLWSSLTLALLTLPVVIVATEEALAAVPSSMREGSYACGASKWQTIRYIVLPRAMPGILTGMILAMARGAGEVAPLMLVGAVKLAPELPIDRFFPFIHPERSFMHLGFHIYDLGFQSQNSEAAKPMVFTTTLLLITIVLGLNLVGIMLRARLRRKFEGGAFG